MPDLDVAPTSESPESSPPSDVPISSADGYDQFTPGELTSFDHSPEPFVDLPDQAKNLVRELVILASRTDVASRRFEVEQAWEARLFERGYQHLLPRRGGGWSLPGEGSKWGPLSTADSSALYSTNIYGRDKDIVTAALSRETPKVTFFPHDSFNIADVQAAEAANKFVPVWQKNNDLRQRLAEMAYYYYTDDRCVLYTRLVVDQQRFGTNEDGSPASQVLTSVYGKLEAKVPMQAQYQKEMHFIQLYNEIDVTTAKARYPWIAKKIRPGSCGIGEIELDKIARVNTKLALLGSYVTGDAMMRNVTEQYTWVRPEMFWEEVITDEWRQFFLENFPKGMLVVYAGQELCFARNESMDDKLRVTHAMPGNGQNRRALGTNNLSVQKRLNAYLDILDDFARRTVPRRLYDSDAFDVQALQNQDNTPGGSTPFQRVPGLPVEQLVFVEPTPQPQPFLPELTKMFFEDIPQSLVGSVPSLFGGSTNTETVGGIAIQRDQALARMGIPWAEAKAALTDAANQAVLAASQTNEPIFDQTESGTVTIDPNQLKGRVIVYPEYDSAFPESWRDRETRYTELVAGAAGNPFYASLLKIPSNLRAIADNVRMADLTVPGEESVDKQLLELTQLKMTAPLPNPALLQARQQLTDAQAGMALDKVNGKTIPPEAVAMIQAIEQQLQSMPPLVTSIPVAQDASENHEVEAATVFEWMNSEEGMRFKSGNAEQQAGFQNAHLHWQAHMEMAAKLAPPQPAPHPPSISFKGEDLPPDAQTQALAQAGIKSSPQDQLQAKNVDTQHKIAQKVVPKAVPATESINIHKLKRGQ